MPIDPRIPLMGNPLQIEPQGNVLARVMAMRNAQSEQAMRQMQMQEVQARWQQMQQERAQQAEQQQRAQNYLGSINSNAGPARPFNPAEAAGALGIEGASKLGAMLAAPTRKLQSVAPGASVIDEANGQLVFNAPAAPEKAPEQLRTLAAIYGEGTPGYQQAARMLGAKITTHAPAPSAVSYGAPFAGTIDGQQVMVQAPNKPGAAAQVLRVGDKTVSPPAKDATAKDPTEFQAKAALYFTSMGNASEVLGQIERTNAWRPTPQELAVPEGFRSTVVPEGRQKYLQSQRQWIDSINRVRSGANLPEVEYQRAVSTFFPVIGDGPTIRDQKAKMRKLEEDAMRTAAGRAVPQATSPTSGDDPLGIRGR
jgi:hypothetical protein